MGRLRELAAIWTFGGKNPGEHERNCAYSITKTFRYAALRRMNKWQTRSKSMRSARKRRIINQDVTNRCQNPLSA
jgi:hypothetical protein